MSQASARLPSWKTLANMANTDVTGGGPAAVVTISGSIWVARNEAAAAAHPVMWSINGRRSNTQRAPPRKVDSPPAAAAAPLLSPLRSPGVTTAASAAGSEAANRRRDTVRPPRASNAMLLREYDVAPPLVVPACCSELLFRSRKEWKRDGSVVPWSPVGGSWYHFRVGDVPSHLFGSMVASDGGEGTGRRRRLPPCAMDDDAVGTFVRSVSAESSVVHAAFPPTPPPSTPPRRE